MGTSAVKGDDWLREATGTVGLSWLGKAQAKANTLKGLFRTNVSNTTSMFSLPVRNEIVSNWKRTHRGVGVLCFELNRNHSTLRKILLCTQSELRQDILRNRNQSQTETETETETTFIYLRTHFYERPKSSTSAATHGRPGESCRRRGGSTSA